MPAGKASGVRHDFKRRTAKVGAKKLAPANVTNTSFKWARLAIRDTGEQATLPGLGGAGAGHASAEHIAAFVAEQCASLRNHHATSRREAADTLQLLVWQEPDACRLRLRQLLQCAVDRLMDPDADARAASVALIAALVGVASTHQLAPSVSLLCVYLASALTKMQTAFRLDALACVARILQLHPSLADGMRSYLMPPLIQLLDPQLHALVSATIIPDCLPARLGVGNATVRCAKDTGDDVEAEGADADAAASSKVVRFHRQKITSNDARAAAAHVLCLLLASTAHGMTLPAPGVATLGVSCTPAEWGAPVVSVPAAACPVTAFAAFLPGAGVSAASAARSSAVHASSTPATGEQGTRLPDACTGVAQLLGLWLEWLPSASTPATTASLHRMAEATHAMSLLLSDCRNIAWGQDDRLVQAAEFGAGTGTPDAQHIKALHDFGVAHAESGVLLSPSSVASGAAALRRAVASILLRRFPVALPTDMASPADAPRALQAALLTLNARLCQLAAVTVPCHLPLTPTELEAAISLAAGVDGTHPRAAAAAALKPSSSARAPATAASRNRFGALFEDEEASAAVAPAPHSRSSAASAMGATQAKAAGRGDAPTPSSVPPAVGQKRRRPETLTTTPTAVERGATKSVPVQPTAVRDAWVSEAALLTKSQLAHTRAGVAMLHSLTARLVSWLTEECTDLMLPAGRDGDATTRAALELATSSLLTNLHKLLSLVSALRREDMARMWDWVTHVFTRSSVHSCTRSLMTVFVCAHLQQRVATPLADAHAAAAPHITAPPPDAVTAEWLAALPRLLWSLAQQQAEAHPLCAHIVHALHAQARACAPLSARHVALQACVRQLAPMFFGVKALASGAPAASAPSSTLPG
ncbi:hypothetical protein EON68_00185, partial [archaeon]